MNDKIIKINECGCKSNCDNTVANENSTFNKLTAVVAHELRNPLGTIRNSVYIVKQRINDQFIVDGVIEEAMGRISRNIERCDDIVKELIEYSRTTKMLLQKTNLHSLMEEVIYDIQHYERIKIYNNINKELYLNIDEEKMRRVFINLINNSREAILDDDIGPGYGNIKLSNIHTKDGITITIFDNGPGILKSDICKIMEPLVSTKSFGIGLGLPIVEKIVKAHHGSMEITSSVSEYTKINIHLPKYRIL